MDDRMEDEDDPISWSHQRKVQSFSQPLGRDAAIVAAKRTAAARKHSLDDTNATNPYTFGDDPSNHPFFASYPYHERSSSNEPPPHHHNNSHVIIPSRPSSSFSSTVDGDALTLERAMSEYGGAPGTLPEFMGTGGGSGIFKVPVRAAVHPARPPAVELRPHPLRETQFGAFMRTIACTEKQIWAAQESGVRYWNVSDVFEVAEGRMKKGDEESAPFKESEKTSPVLCLVVDEASETVFCGHKDGKIRAWKVVVEEVVDGSGSEGRSVNVIKEWLTWQAHRTPVMCMTISSHGNFTRS